MRRAAFAGVALVLVAAGCGHGPDDDPADAVPPAVRLPASTDPVETDGLIWAAGQVVHLADGTDIDLGTTPLDYVVGGDGVYFRTEGSGLDAAAVPNGDLFLADGSGSATKVAEGVATPLASPDGRHLVYLDVGSGEPDAFGTPQAAFVVVDLMTGEEVVRTTEGAGDYRRDDLAALYPDLEIGVRQVDDTTAYVEGEGTFAIDLASGEVTEVPESTDWYVSPDDPTSPGGGWRFVERSDARDVLVADQGRRIVPAVGAPRWSLEFWADAHTVVGVAVDGPVGRGPDPYSRRNTFSLFSCRVPTGACQRVPESAGRTVRFPNGASESTGTVLRYAG